MMWTDATAPVIQRALEPRQPLERPAFASRAAPWCDALREKFARAAQASAKLGCAADKSRLAYAESLVQLALADIRDPVLPFIVPLPDGGVQVEWHRAGADFEIAFYADGEISALFADRRITSGAGAEAEGVKGIDLLLRHAPRMAEGDGHAHDVQVPQAPPSIAVAA